MKKSLILSKISRLGNLMENAKVTEEKERKKKNDEIEGVKNHLVKKTSVQIQ